MQLSIVSANNKCTCHIEKINKVQIYRRLYWSTKKMYNLGPLFFNACGWTTIYCCGNQTKKL
jgi:hypothetical protein